MSPYLVHHIMLLPLLIVKSRPKEETIYPKAGQKQGAGISVFLLHAISDSDNSRERLVTKLMAPEEISLVYPASNFGTELAVQWRAEDT